MIGKISAAAVASLFWFSNTFGFSGKISEFALKQQYRLDTRRHSHAFYISRVWLTVDCLGKDNSRLLQISPFIEARRNVNRGIWAREEAGVEAGRYIAPWLYVGGIIQKTWTNEDYRFFGIYEKRRVLESELKLLYIHDLLSPKHKMKLKGFILDEVVYDHHNRATVRNEVAIGLIAPIAKHIDAEINWRHIDRVHYYDSDLVEAAMYLKF